MKLLKHLTPGDFIIFLVAAGCVTGSYIMFWGENVHARHVEVLVSGKKQYILDLNEEKRIKVDGRLGASIIEIKDGQVRFVESPCTSKQCIRSGWVSQVNDLAACLPNGVSLHLVGPNARFDSINF